uniref:I/6 autoantigen n=1 Tax=Trypanosoma brucei brucei TaxID=5702 RepID=AGI6_TRYBB|nr:RecName: Full=I/6 autoantigen [Trypanosoma brucei brucei]CAA65390.1 I/6 protein [Trypanosoma brucei]
MLCPPDVAFEKRHFKRRDGNKVVPPSIALVAGLESGFLFKLSAVEDVARRGQFPGLLTEDGFLLMCEESEHIRDAYAMAKHLVALAPDGIFTRATLQEAAGKVGSTQDTLSVEEVDALFNALDSDNRGYVSVDEFMDALYGEEGREAMREIRREYMRRKIEVEGEPSWRMRPTPKPTRKLRQKRKREQGQKRKQGQRQKQEQGQRQKREQGQRQKQEQGQKRKRERGGAQRPPPPKQKAGCGC